MGIMFWDWEILNKKIKGLNQLKMKKKYHLIKISLIQIRSLTLWMKNLKWRINSKRMIWNQVMLMKKRDRVQNMLVNIFWKLDNRKYTKSIEKGKNLFSKQFRNWEKLINLKKSNLREKTFTDYSPNLKFNQTMIWWIRREKWQFREKKKIFN